MANFLIMIDKESIYAKNLQERKKLKEYIWYSLIFGVVAFI